MSFAAVSLNGHRPDVVTVADLIAARAALGEKPLAVIEGETLTYAEADLRANRIANALVELGVGKGDVVATLMHNSVEHVCTWFGSAKLGAIWAPLNIALVQLDLKAALADAAPRVVVVDEALLGNLAVVGPQLEGAGTTVVVNGKVPPGSGSVPFQDLLAGSPRRPDVEVEPSDPAGLIFTGGSTGRPKGVLVSNL